MFWIYVFVYETILMPSQEMGALFVKIRIGQKVPFLRKIMDFFR
jgi:hypothetical protein